MVRLGAIGGRPAIEDRGGAGLIHIAGAVALDVTIHPARFRLVWKSGRGGSGRDSRRREQDQGTDQEAEGDASHRTFPSLACPGTPSRRHHLRMVRGIEAGATLPPPPPGGAVST